MNFTREPIIETIISAREGYKIAVKSTKFAEFKEFLVDAIEIVSFNGTLFYRSQEKPKPFLAPVSDFEVSEIKETRFVLKNASLDKSVKITSSKEHLHRSLKEASEIASNEEDAPEFEEELVEISSVSNDAVDTRKKRQRRRKDRIKQAKMMQMEEITESVTEAESDKGGDTTDEAIVSSPSSASFRLIAPPPVLIVDSFANRQSAQVYQESFLSSEQLDEEKVEEIRLESNLTLASEE